MLKTLKSIEKITKEESMYTMLNLASEVFEEVKKPLTIRAIWDNAVKLGLISKLDSIGRTPWKSLSSQIYVDIRDNDNSNFEQISIRPAMFYLKKYKLDLKASIKSKVCFSKSINGKETATTSECNHLFSISEFFLEFS